MIFCQWLRQMIPFNSKIARSKFGFRDKLFGFRDKQKQQKNSVTE
jgi:hypothetical protein